MIAQGLIVQELAACDGGYPYLRISKALGVPYDMVLRLADVIRDWGDSERRSRYQAIRATVDPEQWEDVNWLVFTHVIRFEEIQAGTRAPW